MGAPEDARVRRNAVAFREDQDVAERYLAPRDALLHTVADHERARARHVPQGFQSPLRLVFLIDRNRHDEGHEAEEHQRLLRVSQDDIDQTAGTEEEEDGIFRDFEGDAEKSGAFGRGKFVVPFAAQARGGFVCREALDG